MNLQIDAYIHDLLYNYDCVIIPHFGGFVSNYRGAEIHPTQHLFTPPGKQLAFNKNLTMNDGLLANFIAQTNRISYAEALRLIELEVAYIKSILASGEKVHFKNIGLLKLDVEKNLQFNPSTLVNFNTDSFGLSAFQSNPISRAGSSILLEKNILASQKQSPSKRLSKKLLVPLVIAPMALLSYVLSPWGPSNSLNLNEQFSGYFSSPPMLYHPAKNTFDLSPSLPLILKSEAVSEMSSAIVEPADVSGDHAALLANNTSESEKDYIPSKKYILIAGCFSIPQNAQKQIDLLHQKNIDASIAGLTKNGLYRVSCGSYDTVNEAEQAASEIRALETEVWILKN